MKLSKSRLGQFFLLIGLIMLIIFFGTDPTVHRSYGWFLGGFALAFLGGYLIWRGWKPAPTTERFRSVRRMQQKQAERKAKKKEKQEAKASEKEKAKETEREKGKT